MLEIEWAYANAPSPPPSVQSIIHFVFWVIIVQKAFHADGSAGGILEHILDYFGYSVFVDVPLVGEGKIHVGTRTLLPSRLGVPMCWFGDAFG